MRVVVTGGGTAGHITPLKPVLHELKKLDSSIELMFIAQKGDRFADLIEPGGDVDHVEFIRAGKYRRYPDEPLLRRVFDIRTHAQNTRDLFYIAQSALRSKKILKQFQPDVVFGNGGYVSVPVGWAAGKLGIPLVIHESDARPGIATRILTSRASKVLFGVPTETTTVGGKPALYVGIPLREAFTDKPKDSQAEMKHKLGFDAKKPLITISGSSLGAEAINNALIESFDDILKVTQVAHITGQSHLETVQSQLGEKAKNQGYQALSFVENIDQYFRASDIIINRASATIFTELAVLAKPTVLIPAPQLGDQIENARILEGRGVVMVIDQKKIEDEPALFANRILELLDDKEEQKRLSAAIGELAKPDAAKDVAKVLFEYEGSRKK